MFEPELDEDVPVVAVLVVFLSCDASSLPPSASSLNALLSPAAAASGARVGERERQHGADPGKTADEQFAHAGEHTACETVE